MSKTANNSAVIEIVRRNGDFRKNYGLIIGGYLYLRSIHAVSGRSLPWGSFVAITATLLTAWIRKYGSHLPY